MPYLAARGETSGDTRLGPALARSRRPERPRWVGQQASLSRQVFLATVGFADGSGWNAWRRQEVSIGVEAVLSVEQRTFPWRGAPSEP